MFFAKLGFKRDEVVVHWVGNDMFKIADETIENYPAGKQLVLCIGDPDIYTLDELEQWENNNQQKAVYQMICTFIHYTKSKIKQGTFRS